MVFVRARGPARTLVRAAYRRCLRKGGRSVSTVPDRLEEGEELISSSGATTNSKLEAMLRKVRGLLAQADHENTSPAEAQVFRNKAEALMMRYRIDEAMLA